MQTIFSEGKRQEEISPNDNANIQKDFKEFILNVSEDTLDPDITPEKSRFVFYPSH
jgi:hypothetical protein